MIAKISIDGGQPVTVKQLSSPVFAGPISPDGNLMLIGLYDDASTQPWKLGVMSLSNGEIVSMFDGSQVVPEWTEDSRSLITLRDMNRSNLWLQPIDGSDPQQLTKFDDGVIRSFAVSPDFKRLAISRGNHSAEAVLISF
jgi:hypothetical protein